MSFFTKLFSNESYWESDDFHNARNSDNEEELIQLSLHTDPRVRLQVVQNSATPIGVLMDMVDDRNHKVSLYAYYHSVNIIRSSYASVPVTDNELAHQEPLCDI